MFDSGLVLCGWLGLYIISVIRGFCLNLDYGFFELKHQNPLAEDPADRILQKTGSLVLRQTVHLTKAGGFML